MIVGSSCSYMAFTRIKQYIIRTEKYIIFSMKTPESSSNNNKLPEWRISWWLITWSQDPVIDVQNCLIKTVSNIHKVNESTAKTKAAVGHGTRGAPESRREPSRVCVHCAWREVVKPVHYLTPTRHSSHTAPRTPPANPTQASHTSFNHLHFKINL